VASHWQRVGDLIGSGFEPQVIECNIFVQTPVAVILISSVVFKDDFSISK